MCVKRAVVINASEGKLFLTGVLQGDRENFWRAKIYGAQGFFSVAQGERIYVKNGGKNLKRQVSHM